MPQISKVKEERIKEMILQYLFQQSPKALFTYHVARELARDEEYMKNLLLQLEAKDLIVSVKKNSRGKEYSRRIRWRLSNKVYEAYKTLDERREDTRIRDVF